MARQKKLPHIVKDESIKDIEDSIEAYTKCATQLQRARKKMGEVKEAFLKQMADHKLEQYRSEDGKLYKIAPGKTKIVVIDPEDGEDGEDEEPDAEDPSAN